MSRSIQSLAILALAVLIASPLSAADEKKKKKPARQGKQRDQISMFLAKVDLSEEQKKQVGEIKKKYGEQLAAARKGVAGLFTEEQRKARQEAMKKAKADGKTAKEARAAVEAAVGLTADQKESAKKAQADMREIMGKIRAELKDVLTEEQAKAAGLNRGQRQAKGAKKPGEKKKKAKEAA